MKAFPDWFANIGEAQLLRVEVAEDHDISGRQAPRTCAFCEEYVSAHFEPSEPSNGYPGRNETTAVRLLVRHDGTDEYAESERAIDGDWHICCPDCLWDAQVLQRQHAQEEALAHLETARAALVRCGSVAPNDARWLQEAGSAVDTARKAIRDIALEATVEQQLEAS